MKNKFKLWFTSRKWLWYSTRRGDVIIYEHLYYIYAYSDWNKSKGLDAAIKDLQTRLGLIK